MNTDAEVNTCDTQVGAALEGYPYVLQSNDYNTKLSIANEVAAPTYQRTINDDLRYIWDTNNRDNIDDLNKPLKMADVNAYGEDFYGSDEYYGAKNLHTVYSDPDFSRFLHPKDDSPAHFEEIKHNWTPRPTDTYEQEDCLCNVKYHKILWFVFLVFIAVMLFGGINNLVSAKDTPTKETPPKTT